MQKATSTEPQPRQPLALLLIGPPGGGKTTLSLQFPSPYIADIDGNMDGPVRHIKKKLPQFEYFYDRIGFTDKGTPVAVEDQWQRLETSVYAALKAPEPKTVVIDGLTHLNNILIAHVCKQAGKSAMDISLWIPFRQTLLKFIMTCRSTNKNLVMLCHEETQYKQDPSSKNALSQVIDKRTPAVSSKLTDYFGAFFTDMWRCESRPGPGGKPTYWVQVSKKPYDDLKNSFGEFTDVDVTSDGFAAVNKFLKLS
jgi:hypothetical protein